MAAFVLAHLRFAARVARQLPGLGLTFPFATAVCVFIRVRDLGALGSYWGVILRDSFQSGLSIVLLTGLFFAECPTSF